MMSMANRQAGTSGQAMTEFLIVTAFVLMPLFLGIPMLGKYIDIKQATIQAARYEAWEYTVWYDPGDTRGGLIPDNNEVLTNFDPTLKSGGRVTVPMKSEAQTRSESRQRFFSAISPEAPPAITNTDSAGWIAANRNPTWRDHRNRPIYAGNDGASTQTTDGPTPTVPVLGQALQIMIDVLDFAFSAIGKLVGLICNSNTCPAFTAMNTDGYSSSTVSVVSTPAPIFMTTPDLQGANNFGAVTNLSFSSTAGVLTDGWNSGGTEHTYSQTGGTVPTVVLKELLTIGPMQAIWSIASLLAPELAPCQPIPAVQAVINFVENVSGADFNGPEYVDGHGSLWLGHIDGDAVHPDRLSGGGSHVCDDAGICKFEPNVAPLPKDCIP